MSVISISAANFESEVVKSDKPVLLDFYADWCGPCRLMSGIVEQIAQERGDIKVGSVNVDEQRELAAAFRIMGVPTFALIKDGKVIRQESGARGIDEMYRFIDG